MYLAIFNYNYNYKENVINYTNYQLPITNVSDPNPESCRTSKQYSEEGIT